MDEHKYRNLLYRIIESGKYMSAYDFAEYLDKRRLEKKKKKAKQRQGAPALDGAGELFFNRQVEHIKNIISKGDI